MTLVSDKLRMRVQSEGIRRDDTGWDHHAYKVTLTGPGGQMTTSFRMGLGHDDEPTLEDVMSSLRSEARIVENDEFDDVDATRAQERAMRKIADDLKRILRDDYDTFVSGEGVTNHWEIKQGRQEGSGGFMSPPGSPQHRYSVHEIDGVTGEAITVMGLDSALKPENGVPDDIRARVQQIIDDNPLRPSELWLGYVYGYFRNSYSPDGVNRNVSNAVFPKADEPAPPPEHHLGYLLVKSYFADHEPREDLIASGGAYGTRSCMKCGQTLQYEAKVDAFAEAITAKLTCPKGGQHEPVASS